MSRGLVGTGHRARVVAARAGAGVAVLGLMGCAGHSPLATQGERELRQSIVESAARELRDAQQQPGAVATVRNEGVSRLNFREDVLEELHEMAGPESYRGAPAPLGMDLTGREARTITVSLERVLRSTAANNLAVQFARVTPSINEAQVIAAEAAFDWTLFSNLNYNNTDSPRVSTGTGNVATTSNADVQQVVSGQVGIRKNLIAGGRFTMQHDASYSDADSPNQTTSPNPAEQASVTLQWDQPLLRNFGSDASQSEVRVNRNAQRASIQTLRRDMIRQLTDAERTYWQLVRAHEELKILQRVLERGEKVREQVEVRFQLNTDVNSAQLADAKSRVERRRIDVLRAQTNLQIISDQLKTLMNDPDVPVGSEIVVLPADAAPDAPVQFSLLECLSTAIRNRPEVMQAVLAIDDASIRAAFSDNQRLPDLSMRLQTRLSALDERFTETYEEMLSGAFVDYLVGLSFEMPIGNRRPEAEARRRRLERMQSVISYRNTLQQVTAEVKNALYRIKQNYPLIEQTRASRLASAENVRVLLIEKEQGLGFTVERLNIELNSQEQLANAEREEVAALTDFNTAIADLFAAMGTTLERNNVEFVVEGE